MVKSVSIELVTENSHIHITYYPDGIVLVHDRWYNISYFPPDNPDSPEEGPFYTPEMVAAIEQFRERARTIMAGV